MRLFRAGFVVGMMLVSSRAAADLGHTAVTAAPVMKVEVGGADVPWSDIEAPRAPGTYTLRFAAKGEAVEIPHCNGRGKIVLDGTVRDPGSNGTSVIVFDTKVYERALAAARQDDTAGIRDLVREIDRHREQAAQVEHDIRIDVKVSTYEKRIACAYAPRVGPVVSTREGLATMKLESPHASKGGGEAVVFVPKGHDANRPGALLVGLHPWNSNPWTYAAYHELLEQAQAKDVVLLMPSGLGNSLYVEDAEDEVVRAIDAVSKEVGVDRQRVSLWGASMGGAGATTISFHRPDRFAFVASYFGDSKYDLTTYVKGVLGGEAGAHRVNALDVLENARHLPVWLIHGEQDTSSPVRQSTMLHDAMKKAGFKVDFDRVPQMGHEGPLVVRYIARVVDRAADARAPQFPARVSFRSVRSGDNAAYGVRIVREKEGDAFADIEKRDDGIHVLRAENVRSIVLRSGALGAKEGDAIDSKISVSWER